MLNGWAVIAVALLYFGLLFALAAYGDRARPAWASGWARPYIYSFSIAVYCTSWTFFGSVGLAAVTGLDFLSIYLGPIFAFSVASPLIIRVAHLAKAQNITSVADFISARYGKSQSLAVIITLALMVGAVPYIALQLKAISLSVSTVLEGYGTAAGPLLSPSDIGLWAAIALAVFASLFGTRFIDATEHQSGLMLAIAAESFIKLLTFLAVGAFVTWGMFGGFADLVERARDFDLLAAFEGPPRWSVWITFAGISFVCVFLLPRQFHVMIVENMGTKEIRYAAILIPLYMIAINIFVVPLALGGMIMFSDGPVSPDMYVLALPMSVGSHAMTIAAFIGGLSAATAMVIAESIALSIMVSNNVVVPLLLRGSEGSLGDMRRFLLPVRRVAILLILLLSYTYFRVAADAELAQIGLLAFAAIAQLAPAFFGGLFWRRASAQGALLAILVGFAVWAFTLLIPMMFYGGLAAARAMDEGLFGVSWLRPTALLGYEFDPFVHGVFWSLALNVCAYVFGSLLFAQSAMDRLQAHTFVGRGRGTMGQSVVGWNTPVRVGELQSAVARYLGEERTKQAFEEFAAARKLRPSAFDHADIHLVRYAEHLLASVIGTSSRMVLSLLLRGGPVTKKAALRLLDEASIAVQNSRDILQTALDHARHGVAVYDSDLNLVCWNREYVRLFDIPENFLRVGKPLDDIIRSNAERGIYGARPVDEILAERMQHAFTRTNTFRSTLEPSGRVVEVRADDMPDGSVVVTFTDVTEAAATEKALEARVTERTHELVRAKAEAERANSSKTRFLAAASHDILQPLNAARLYVASLAERIETSPHHDLVANIDASLQSVEEIFSVLLDISRLDAGAFTPDVAPLPLGDLFRQLEVEFAPMAQEKKLDLRIVRTSRWIRSDRRLLRRLLQNLISNAIKYTPEGRVLVGVRRAGRSLRVEVWDTGLGIPAANHRTVFKEFQRLNSGARVARGLGLGLSIVERIGRILGHEVHLRSETGKGSVFAVTVPAARPLPRSAEQRPGSVPPPSFLAGTRVLCIDNEAAILDGMARLLEGWECRVMTALTPAEAVAAVERHGTPDIIIVDYHLDRSDGLSIMRDLRQRLGDVPGILVTADRAPALREHARTLGLEVLHKPLRPGALRALLAQLRATRPAAE